MLSYLHVVATENIFASFRFSQFNSENRTLETMLSAYVADHQRDWDSHLPYVMMAYQSTEQESTRLTLNT